MSTLEFVHENVILTTTQTQGITDVLLLVISTAMQRLRNAIMTMLWQSWTRTMQITALLVFYFIAISKTPCYERKTLQQKVTRRAWKWLCASCDAMCTWVDGKIKMESPYRRRTKHVLSQHRSRNKRAVMAMTVLAMHANAHTERRSKGAVMSTRFIYVGF